MWAQLIKARIKPGQEDEAQKIAEEFQAQSRAEGMGPVRVHVLRNQKDPLEQYTLAFFESEAKAREAESNPKQAALIQRFWGAYEDGPEFVDLNPFFEWTR